jgi:hypothetical protein
MNRFNTESRQSNNVGFRAEIADCYSSTEASIQGHDKKFRLSVTHQAVTKAAAATKVATAIGAQAAVFHVSAPFSQPQAEADTEVTEAVLAADARASAGQ